MDEQAATDRFVELAGGRARADQLFRLYMDSHPTSGRWPRETISKEEVFRKKAERAGFPKAAVEALLNLQ